MIPEKAHELGRLIGQTDDFKTLHRAREGLRQATELTGKLDRLERLARTLESRAREGQEPPEEEVDEYDRLLMEVQADSHYQQVIAAQSNFDKLMVRVNQHIVEGMEKGAQSSIITLG